MSQTLYCPRCHGPTTTTTDWQGNSVLCCDAYRPCEAYLITEYASAQDAWERNPTDSLPTNPNNSKLTRDSGSSLTR